MRNILIILGCLVFGSALAADKVTVMVGWFVNPNQAPLVVALQKGFFKKHDLAVSIIEPSDTSSSPKLAAAGKVDIGITSQPQLYLQIQEGLPLMKVSTLVKNPLNNLLVRKDSGINQLSDLKGKTIGYSLPGFDSVILGAMLKSVGLSLEDVKIVNVNWAITQSLLSQKVDGVIGAYRVFENNELALAGVEPFGFYPEDHGVPAYDESILVASTDLQNDPRFARFNEALREAVAFMRSNPEEAWQAFISYKKGLGDKLNRLAWEQELPAFADVPAEHDEARYEQVGKFLLDNGLLKKAVTIPVYQAP